MIIDKQKGMIKKMIIKIKKFATFQHDEHIMII